MFSVIPWYLFLGSNNCKVDITYNATLWRFHLAIVATETQKLFLCTVVDLHVTVNKMKPPEYCQGHAPMDFFAALCSYEIFHTTFKKIKVLRSSGKVPDIFVRFLSNLEFLDGFSLKSAISNFMKSVQLGLR